LRRKLKAATEIGDLTQLLDLIDNGEFGLLHFASHNIQTNVLTASYVPIGGKHFEVAFLSPALRNRYRQQAPLVFMNACRSAGLAPNYTHLTGWASAFIRTGVGAFIGSLWEVPDDAALTYAEAFYQALLDGKSLGEGMKEGRRATERRSPGDPTWLAYTLYGDPNTVATLAPISAENQPIYDNEIKALRHEIENLIKRGVYDTPHNNEDSLRSLFRAIDMLDLLEVRAGIRRDEMTDYTNEIQKIMSASKGPFFEWWFDNNRQIFVTNRRRFTELEYVFTTLDMSYVRKLDAAGRALVLQVMLLIKNGGSPKKVEEWINLLDDVGVDTPASPRLLPNLRA
jgi:hypothetical protein